MSEPRLRAATPNLKTAHAGASTRKTQHLPVQPKASNAADIYMPKSFAFSHIEYSPCHFAAKWLFCEAKRAFPPTWRVLECGTRVWKTQNNRPSASAHPKHLVAGAQFFPVLAPACARREDWVAALSLIEAHSHTLSSFRRIKL